MEAEDATSNPKKTLVLKNWTILDRYIFRRMIVTFVYSLLLFNAISVVFDFVEHIDDFIRRDAPGSAIFWFLFTFFPWISGLLAHLFLFISVIFFTSRMANKTEIVPILATGISFRRFLLPYMVGASIIFVILLFAKHTFIPLSNKVRFEIQDKYLFPPDPLSDHNKHVRIGPQSYAYTEYYTSNRNRAARFTIENFDTSAELKTKIASLEAFYDSSQKVWRMHKVMVTRYGKYRQNVSYRDSMNIKLNLEPGDFFEEIRPREEYTSQELRSRIAKAKRLGLGSYNILYVELYKRTADAFAVFIFVLLGACIGAKKTRGGSGIHLAIGIVICLVYMFVQQMTSQLSIKSGLDPLLAVWIPNAFFAVVAYYYYRQRMK